MSKKEKYYHAIHCLEEIYERSKQNQEQGPVFKRRQQELRDAIVALGGPDPEGSGGPGEEGPGGP